MNKRKLGTFVTALLMSSPALADFSTQFSLGNATQSNSLLSAVPESDSDISFSVIQQFVFIDYLAIEYGYRDFGEAEYTFESDSGNFTTVKNSTTALTVGAKGIVPLPKKISLNARLGLACWDWKNIETNNASSGREFSERDRGVSAYYGLGVEYEINENIQIGIDYTAITIGTSSRGADVDNEISDWAFKVSLSI